MTAENVKGVFHAQLLQEQAKKGEEHWASVDKSYQSLMKIIHQGTVQVLDDQMEEERKRLDTRNDQTRITGSNSSLKRQKNKTKKQPTDVIYLFSSF